MQYSHVYFRLGAVFYPEFFLQLSCGDETKQGNVVDKICSEVEIPRKKLPAVEILSLWALCVKFTQSTSKFIGNHDNEYAKEHWHSPKMHGKSENTHKNPKRSWQSNNQSTIDVHHEENRIHVACLLRNPCSWRKRNDTRGEESDIWRWKITEKNPPHVPVYNLRCSWWKLPLPGCTSTTVSCFPCNNP